MLYGCMATTLLRADNVTASWVSTQQAVVDERRSAGLTFGYELSLNMTKKLFKDKINKTLSPSEDHLCVRGCVCVIMDLSRGMLYSP